MKQLYQWMGQQVHNKHATKLFSLLSFIEGFFFVPLGTLLVIYCLAKREKAFMYAAIATVLSVLGGVVGYLVGLLLWEAFSGNILNYLITPEHFAYLKSLYATYQSWTIFLATLMPIPFKAVSISAGFCKIPVINFVILSMMGRGLRFFALASSVYIWGDKINQIIDKYFYYIFFAGIFALGLILYISH